MDKDEIQRWMKYAEYDLESAQVLRDHVYLNGALFHCQQAAEKALKALYMAEVNRMFPRVHALALIAEPTSLSRDWMPFLRELTSKYSEARYPNFPVEDATGVYDADYTNQIIENTKELVSWIRRRLNEI